MVPERELAVFTSLVIRRTDEFRCGEETGFVFDHSVNVMAWRENDIHVTTRKVKYCLRLSLRDINFSMYKGSYDELTNENDTDGELFKYRVVSIIYLLMSKCSFTK